MNNNTNTTIFSPVLGGNYYRGRNGTVATRGYWWGSEAYSGTDRYRLVYYDSGGLENNHNYRDNGYYIRCVSEEKDVSDLTYMQDMTPSVAANTA